MVFIINSSPDSFSVGLSGNDVMHFSADWATHLRQTPQDTE